MSFVIFQAEERDREERKKREKEIEEKRKKEEELEKQEAAIQVCYLFCA